MITSGTRGGDMTQVTIGQIQRGDSDERSLSRVGPRDWKRTRTCLIYTGYYQDHWEGERNALLVAYSLASFTLCIVKLLIVSYLSYEVVNCNLYRYSFFVNAPFSWNDLSRQTLLQTAHLSLFLNIKLKCSILNIWLFMLSLQAILYLFVCMFTCVGEIKSFQFNCYSCISYFSYGLGVT